MEILELLKELTAVHGPSGDEGNIRAKLAELAAPFAAGVTADTLGNLIVHKPGDGPRVMFAAHMDSTGFIVTHIEKEGFLRVGRLGGIAPKEAAYTPIRFKSGVQGVFVPEEKAEFGKLKLDECFVDIGAKDEAEAKKLVQVGDTAVYDAPLRVQGSLYGIYGPGRGGTAGSPHSRVAGGTRYLYCGGCYRCGRHPRLRKERHFPAGEGGGGQSDGFLSPLPPAGGFAAGGAGPGRRHSLPTGRYAGRRYRRRRHPHCAPGR